MSSPSSISINNDFPASQTSISIWSSNDEFSTGVDDNLSPFSDVFIRNHSFDDVFDELLSKEVVLVGHLIVVLGGDENGVDPLWDHGSVHVLVDNGDLRLSVRSHPRQNFVLSNISKRLSQFSCPYMRKRHSFFALI